MVEAKLCDAAGANGTGSRTMQGGIAPTLGDAGVVLGADETENLNEDGVFVSRPRTEGGDGCDDTDEAELFCEFDDMVIWISSPVLLGELVNVGQLP